MFRFVLILLLLVIGAAAYLWHSTRSLPDWYEEGVGQDKQVVQNLSKQIEQQGMAKFLGDKFADVLRGEVALNEAEFNGILLASLASHKDGRRLLEISDVVRADLHNGELEFGAIINLDKVRRAEPKAREALEKALEVLPFDPGEKVFVALSGKPVARNGDLGLEENVSLQIGALPISAGFLKRAGVPLDRLADEALPLKLLNIRSVKVETGQIVFGVRPKF